jgi:hypothetical protein
LFCFLLSLLLPSFLHRRLSAQLLQLNASNATRI